MKNRWLIILFGSVLACAGYFFKINNPNDTAIFPKCPFLSATGWQCPGCGSQRAIHYLLNGEMGAAFAQNPLLVVSLPYLMVGFWFEYGNLKARFPNARRLFFGQKAVYFMAVSIILFWFCRNLF